METSQPSSHPTTSDIGGFMRELGYLWSNEAQTYYDHSFQFISRKSAERIYEVLIGSKPFTQLKVNGVDILADKKVSQDKEVK